MLKKLILLISLAMLSATSLVACKSDNTPYYDTMCVDYYTGVFEPYSYCQPGHPGYGTLYRNYYVRSGYVAPAVGHRVSGYSKSHFSKPKNASIHTGGVPTSGGKATKVSTKKTSSTTKKTSSNKKGSTPKKKTTPKKSRKH